MQHIPRGQIELAQRLHEIADQIWEERNWVPRDRPLWKDLNNVAVELHRIAAETARESRVKPLGTALPIESVLRFVRPGS